MAVPSVGANIDWQYTIAYTHDIITCILEFLDNGSIACGPLRVSRTWYDAGWQAFRPTDEHDFRMTDWVAKTDRLDMFERILSHRSARWAPDCVRCVLLQQAQAPSHRILDVTMHRIRTGAMPLNPLAYTFVYAVAMRKAADEQRFKYMDKLLRFLEEREGGATKCLATVAYYTAGYACIDEALPLVRYCVDIAERHCENVIQAGGGGDSCDDSDDDSSGDGEPGVDRARLFLRCFKKAAQNGAEQVARYVIERTQNFGSPLFDAARYCEYSHEIAEAVCRALKSGRLSFLASFAKQEVLFARFIALINADTYGDLKGSVAYAVACSCVMHGMDCTRLLIGLLDVHPRAQTYIVSHAPKFVISCAGTYAPSKSRGS